MKRALFLILAIAFFSTIFWVDGVAQTPPPPGGVTLPSKAPVVDEDIRDIRGPLPVSSANPLLIGALVCVFISIVLFTAWLWHRRSFARVRLPYEVALDRLEKARVLMKQDTMREFSIEVSEVVRSYIEQRFKIRAARQTTEEFLHQLMRPSDALLNKHQELLGAFLTHCDLAKFARWVLSGQEMEGMYQSARTFILESGKPEAPSKKTKPEAFQKAAQLESVRA
jgi:hypothetical protein